MVPLPMMVSVRAARKRPSWSCRCRFYRCSSWNGHRHLRGRRPLEASRRRRTIQIACRVERAGVVARGARDRNAFPRDAERVTAGRPAVRLHGRRGTSTFTRGLGKTKVQLPVPYERREVEGGVGAGARAGVTLVGAVGPTGESGPQAQPRISGSRVANRDALRRVAVDMTTSAHCRLASNAAKDRPRVPRVTPGKACRGARSCHAAASGIEKRAPEDGILAGCGCDVSASAWDPALPGCVARDRRR